MSQVNIITIHKYGQNIFKKLEIIDLDAIEIESNLYKYQNLLIKQDFNKFQGPLGSEKSTNTNRFKQTMHNHNHPVNSIDDQIGLACKIQQATHKQKSSLLLISEPENFKGKSDSSPIISKPEIWKRQNFLQYICFMQHHKDIYKRKQLWVLNINRHMEFKHRPWKNYYQSIEAINCRLKQLYKFSLAEIENHKKHMLEYLQKMRIQQNQFLEKPSEFQQYLQSLNTRPINQLYRISFNQNIIESTSLNYTIINIDIGSDEQKTLAFHLNDLKFKAIFVLFNAEFQLKEAEFQNIKNQINQTQDLIEQGKSSNQESQKIKFSHEKYTKITAKQKKKQRYLVQYGNEYNDQEPQCKYIQEQNPQLSHFGEKKQKNNNFYETKNFGKASYQLLDLQVILGLTKPQICILQLLAESKITEFAIMRKSNNILQSKQDQIKGSKAFEQKQIANKVKDQIKGQKAFEQKQIANKVKDKEKETRQLWTEQQMLRLIAFMTLNQKLFIDIHKITLYTLNLAVEFIKTRTVTQTQNKYDNMIRNFLNLKELVQNIFQTYKFIKEQFQVQLKRQYERYPKNPANIILEGEKLEHFFFSQETKNVKVLSLIEQKILRKPFEITCVTHSNKDQQFTEMIQQNVKIFKQEFKLHSQKMHIQRPFTKECKSIQALRQALLNSGLSQNHLKLLKKKYRITDNKEFGIIIYAKYGNQSELSLNKPSLRSRYLLNQGSQKQRTVFLIVTSL